MKTVVYFGNSEKDTDLLYVSGFLSFDPFLYIQRGSKEDLITSSMEMGRAERESKANRILGSYDQQVSTDAWDEIICSYLNERKVNEISVAYNFPFGLVSQLMKAGVKVNIEKPNLGRDQKSPQEIEEILKAQRAAGQAMCKAMEMIKESCADAEKRLYLHGELLTSERLKSEINIEFLRNGAFSGSEPIVVCGDKCVNVHDSGSGPLIAGETIIIDLFPQTFSTRYFSDMTRTFVKGKASKEAEKMYTAVRMVKEEALAQLKSGGSLRKLSNYCTERFKELGFQPIAVDGVWKEGFIHGIGHGVGLDLHEKPDCHPKSIIQPSSVVAIEPGLYYKGIGGVRLEDLVVVGKDGCRNLTEFPDMFEL